MEKMYDEIAVLWPELSPVADYEEEAGQFIAAFARRGVAKGARVLELGSGCGHNAYYLARHFEMVLVDLAPAMLEVSKGLNPNVAHRLGDMRYLRLNEYFDAVFIHDAIAYMTTREDLLAAMTTARVHTRPGGLCVFVPDETKDDFTESHEAGGTGNLRYLSWEWDPNPDDETALTEYAYLIRDDTGAVRVVHEQHTSGLFPEQVWLDSMQAAGLVDVGSETLEHSEVEGGIRVFYGRAPL